MWREVTQNPAPTLGWEMKMKSDGSRHLLLKISGLRPVATTNVQPLTVWVKEYQGHIKSRFNVSFTLPCMCQRLDGVEKKGKKQNRCCTDCITIKSILTVISIFQTGRGRHGFPSLALSAKAWKLIASSHSPVTPMPIRPRRLTPGTVTTKINRLTSPGGVPKQLRKIN